MKIEVIFRAKELLNDRWIYGDLVKFGGRYQINVHEWSKQGELSLTSFKEDTLEIYLGRKDEQGNRIFHKLSNKKGRE